MTILCIHCHYDFELFKRDGKHNYTVPSKIKYVSIKNEVKEIKVVINYVGSIFKKIIAICVHIYSVGTFHQGVLYFQTFIKFESTSLNVPDFFLRPK